MDYKDNAETAHTALEAAGVAALRKRGLPYTQRRALALGLKAMPCGHSCPKAFLAWDSRALKAAIAAAESL